MAATLNRSIIEAVPGLGIIDIYKTESDSCAKAPASPIKTTLHSKRNLAFQSVFDRREKGKEKEREREGERERERERRRREACVARHEARGVL
jgi:hypothetical protein